MTTAARTSRTSRTARAARSIRVVPTLALASAVVVVSVAGSATAAKMITGKQVKNGTITSVDVRNNTITGVDVKNGTVAGADVKDGSITGADLGDGTVGAAELGEASVGGKAFVPGGIAVDHLGSDAKVFGYADTRPDIDLTNCPDQTLSICPGLGSFLVSGPQALTLTGTLDSEGANVPTPTRCGLVHQGTALSVALFAPNKDGLPGDVVPFTLQAVVDITGDDHVELRCTQFAGDDLHVRNVKLQAVSVHGLD